MEMENEVKNLAGSILTTKSVGLQTDQNYIAQRTICQLFFFFFAAQYGQVAEATPAKGKVGISTNVVVQMTLTRKSFDIPDILTCGGRSPAIPVVSLGICLKNVLSRTWHHNSTMDSSKGSCGSGPQ